MQEYISHQVETFFLLFCISKKYLQKMIRYWSTKETLTSFSQLRFLPTPPKPWDILPEVKKKKKKKSLEIGNLLMTQCFE